VRTAWCRQCQYEQHRPLTRHTGIYTHLIFSFALINPTTFQLDDMDAGTAALYGSVAGLKLKQPGLQVWIGEKPNPYYLLVVR
jgi:hypothetical protein